MDLDLAFKSLPPILVVGGWIVVYQLQALQARRKILREEVDKTRGAVEKLLDLSLKFHTSQYDDEKRTAILLAFNDVERRYSLFPRIVTSRAKCIPHAVRPDAVVVDPELLVNLRSAVTLEHFDDPQAVALAYGHKQLDEIRAAAHALITQLDVVLVAALD